MLYISKVVWGLQKMCGCKIFFAQKKTPGGLLNDLPNVSCVMLPLLIVAATVSPVASLREGCFRSGRLVFCRMAPELQPLVKQEKRDVLEASTLRVEITVKDSKLAEKLLSGDWAPGTLGEMAKERLSLRGPLSPKTFDNTGTRFLEVALPSNGHWAKWKILECAAIHCGDGGVTWAMALILANMVSTSLPEYPRLRLLELGAGTGFSLLLLTTSWSRAGGHRWPWRGIAESPQKLAKSWYPTLPLACGGRLSSPISMGILWPATWCWFVGWCSSLRCFSCGIKATTRCKPRGVVDGTPSFRCPSLC